VKENDTMSTNPKDLTPKETSEALIAKDKKSIDRSVRTLMQEMEHENTLLPESPGARLHRAMKIYRRIKPLLGVVNSLPVIPPTWRAALLMFTQALEALSHAAPEVTAGFKAGKDL
jgi:hypothetical protein